MKRTMEMIERKGGMGYRPAPKKRSVKYANDLELRQQIRDGEKRYGLSETDLPSEDDIMDNPGKYTKAMKQALKLINAVKKAKIAYGLLRVY